MKSPTSIACMTAVLISAAVTSLHAQSYRIVRPRSATMPLELYSASLGVGTPAGELRTRSDVDTMVARRQRDIIAAMLASAPATTAVAVGADSQPTATRLTCPMPVSVRDSASVPSMPVVKSPARAVIAGSIAGCQNTLRPSK